MEFNFYPMLWLFFCYSLLGWLGEVVYTALRQKRYQDRGVLNGPLCIIYGFGGLLISFSLHDIRDGWYFVFIGSALYATVIEWIAGHILEHFSQTRWWDYSSHRFNLDGYISLRASLLWGALGLVVVKWGNPLLHTLYALIPQPVRVVLLWILLVVAALDALDTLLTVAGVQHRLRQLDSLGSRLSEMTLRMGLWILGKTESRIIRAVPQADFARPKKAKSTVFAQGCSPYKIILLLIIGAFLGDVAETIFCRITAGYWMSRSSLVWGPFSIVWGLAIAAVTLLMYRYKDRSVLFLFISGTLLGGAYEYLCSVFTEIVFGAVFWDYSAMPLNLGGRINLLYCFFWGIAEVVWFKLAYPAISDLIERVPLRPGKVFTWCLTVFFVVDMLVSSMALVRYSNRLEGIAPANSVEQLLDEHFDNNYMERVYPKAKHTSS